jgi:O-methyltransferase
LISASRRGGRNMTYLEMAKRIKERFAVSGLSPSPRIEILNLLLELGQWLKANPFPVHFQSRLELYRYLNDKIAGNSPIDYLEFGVYRGDATRAWMALNRHPESRFFGFDTFEGLPEDWKFFNAIVPRGAWHAGGMPPDIHDPRVKFTKGLFQETLPDFLKTFTPKNRLVINCDADLYTSTLYLLATLSPLLGPGQIVIFDEFSTVYEFKAFRDFTASFLRKCKLLASAERFCERAAMEFV